MEVINYTDHVLSIFCQSPSSNAWYIFPVTYYLEISLSAMRHFRGLPGHFLDMPADFMDHIRQCIVS
jgi:hypothetical protein